MRKEVKRLEIYISYNENSQSLSLYAKYLINEIKNKFKSVNISLNTKEIEKSDIMIAILSVNDLKVAYEIGIYKTLMEKEPQKHLLTLLDTKLQSGICGECFYEINNLLECIKKYLCFNQEIN